ncbi:MAG TPA: type 1 glutamine amidotransferase domain-containing protein [Paucimonas sp.]|nr:type 1 glutamine amidotransferase domain-containing protein [Paucimonas sp.]
MEHRLNGMSIAILATTGFEQAELTEPRAALDEAGAATKIVSTQRGRITGFHHDAKADQFDVDLTFDEAEADDFDAVLLPGGVYNADQLRIVPQAQQFVRRMQEQGKPIAAICHGAWLLVSAGLVSGRTLTAWPTLQDDIRNAGGAWVDREVVVDGNLVSSRKPDDIPAFNDKLLELLTARFAGSVRGTGDEAGTSIGISG